MSLPNTGYAKTCIGQQNVAHFSLRSQGGDPWEVMTLKLELAR